MEFVETKDLTSNHDVVVCGSVHFDIFADSDFSFKKDGKDLPGKFTISVGGTAFNILLGLIEEKINPLFISVLPRSSILRIVIKNLFRNKGIKYLLYSGQELPEPGFLSIREQGELKYAVTSTCVDHEYYRDKLGRNFIIELCMTPGFWGYFDCNLHETTITHILHYSPREARLFISGVSEVKIKRLLKAINFLKRRGVSEVDSKIHSICLNEAEWNIVKKEKKVKNPLELLKTIWIITCGHKGVKIYAPDNRRKDGKVQWYLPPQRIKEPVSTSGCGDALFAGYIAEIIKGKTIDEAVYNGQKKAFELLFEKGANKIDLTGQIEAFYLDGLTEVLSRKFLEEEKTWIEGLCNNFCVALIDGDDFKKINDTYGHQKGDEVLATLGKILKENLRASDLIIRYGGEEFLVIFFPEVEIEDAKNIVERIRRKVLKHPLLGSFNFTISVGVAKDKNLTTAIKHADEALYRSKTEGKNRTTVYNTK